MRSPRKIAPVPRHLLRSIFIAIKITLNGGAELGIRYPIGVIREGDSFQVRTDAVLIRGYIIRPVSNGLAFHPPILQNPYLCRFKARILVLEFLAIYWPFAYQMNRSRHTNHWQLAKRQLVDINTTVSTRRPKVSEVINLSCGGVHLKFVGVLRLFICTGMTLFIPSNSRTRKWSQNPIGLTSNPNNHLLPRLLLIELNGANRHPPTERDVL